jgi:beta-phosphoglucomutase-like phosphatase (HAD superfamily)
VFNLAFASLGLPETDRAHVCAFEDDPRGIAAARQAGLYVCAITSRYSTSELQALAVPPHAIATSYADFSTMFGLTQPSAPRLQPLGLR